MSLWKRTGGIFWADFSVDGVRYRKSLATCNWKLAKQNQRDMIEAARNGQLDTMKGPKRLFEGIESYLAHKAIARSPRTVELEGERLSIVKKHFGDVKMLAITPAAVSTYQRVRHEAGIAGRTINMDVGALCRVLKQHGYWRRLQGHIQNLPENQQPIGRALTHEEQSRLFEAAASNADWESVCCAAIIAANTSMRPVEVKHLQRKNVDLFAGTVTVCRSKNQTSHRTIPLNQTALKAFARMLERGESLGFTDAEHYVWPASQWGKIDPAKPVKKWDTAWRRLRERAGLPGLRFHDLRHTIITELAEMGVPDHVMESISGHMSRRMLEHYSHIRMEAKRKALDDLEVRRAAETPHQEHPVAATIQ
jgi:integrase